MSPLILLFLLIIAFGVLLAVTLASAAAAGDRLIRTEQDQLEFPVEPAGVLEPSLTREAPARSP